MAIARGAGTEIIRSAHFAVVDSTATPVIIGVQHHIYTVLSIVVMCTSPQAAGNWVDCYLNAFDSKGAGSGADIKIFRQDMTINQTFVWNDKFSFSGCEPTGFSGALSTAAEQDALADQGTTTAQTLYVATEHADDNYDVTVTFIDQNNA